MTEANEKPSEPQTTETPKRLTGYYCGDGIAALGTADYDYLFTSPPCYEDLKSFGVDVKHPETYKTHFWDMLALKMHPKLGTVTVSFTGSRRNGGRVAPKSYFVQQSMFEHGFYLRDVKHVIKSFRYNAYSCQFLDVLTFQRKGTRAIYNCYKKKLYQTYGRDVWGPFGKEIKIDGEVVGQPIDIANYCVQNFTNQGHLVYDPFAGIGTTLAAARHQSCDYLGFEIRQSIYDYGIRKYNLRSCSLDAHDTCAPTSTTENQNTVVRDLTSSTTSTSVPTTAAQTLL